jgi:hypothetical protein
MINEYGGEKGNRKCLEIIERNCYLYGEGFLKQKVWKNQINGVI